MDDLDSLRLELKAEKHTHLKDNEHLLSRAKAAEAEAAQLKSCGPERICGHCCDCMEYFLADLSLDYDGLKTESADLRASLKEVVEWMDSDVVKRTLSQSAFLRDSADEAEKPL